MEQSLQNVMNARLKGDFSLVQLLRALSGNALFDVLFFCGMTRSGVVPVGDLLAAEVTGRGPLL